MQRLVFGLVAALAISACSHDKKNDPAAPVTPPRNADHKPAECPTGIVGAYVEDGDAENSFEIVITDGVLVIKHPESGDAKVDGMPVTNKKTGGANTLICINNTIENRYTEPNGQKGEAVVSKMGDDLKVTDDGRVAIFRRVGPPTSPTETELKLDVIEETPAAPEQPTIEEKPEELTITPITVPAEVSHGDQCPTISFSYQYSQTINGRHCDSGKRTFCSVKAYCEALKIESCGGERRKQDYKAACEQN